MIVLGDNLGAIHTSNNPTSAGRSKHIEIRFLKIREYQKQHRLEVKHISGVTNAADILTKAIRCDKTFQDYLRKIGMVVKFTQCKPE